MLNLKRNWIIKFTILILFSFYAQKSYTQVSSYTFSESNGTYSGITGTTAISSGWDDTVANSISIGFNFTFNSTIYTTCSINSNGYITFGATSSATTNFSPISSTAGYSGAVCALGVDLIDDNSRAITYTTSGTSPNRVFTVQWDDIRRIGRGGKFDFQIKLYETSNVVSVVYGSCAPTGNTSGQNINVQVGLRGTSNADYNNRNKTNHSSWASSTTAGTANTASCTTNGSSAPSNGLTFTWTPLPACTTPTAQPTALVLTPGSTTVAGSFTAASPAPSNYLVVRNTSGVAPSPVNTTSYTIGSTALGGTNVVVDNDTNTSFSDTGLTANTLYYYFIFSFNSSGCSGGPLYLTSSPLNGNTTTTLAYCTPTTSSSTRYINAVQSIGTLNDVTSALAPLYTPTGYGNYTSITIAQQVPNGPINIYTQIVDPTLPTPAGLEIRAYVDWNNDGDFNDAGEQVFTTGNTNLTGDTTFGFIVPTGQTPGNYRFRIKTSDNFLLYGTPQSCSNSTNGETEDYTISIIADCPAIITSVTNGTSCGPTSTVNLTAVGSAGTTGYYWYTTKTGGTGVFSASSTWATPSLGVGTTKYYVTAYNGSCESLFRTEVRATVRPVSSLSFSNSNPTVCGQDDIITLTATGTTEEVTLLTEEFESGLGSFTSTIPTATNAGADSPWSVKPSTYLPTTTVLWKPAVNSGIIGNSFAFTASDYSSSDIVTDLTTTTSISTIGYTSLFLTFKHYYSFFSGDSGRVQVSTDGTAWNTVYTINSDQGSASSFADVAPIDLSAYVGNATVWIRFRYTATFDDGWALDSVRFYGNRPLAPNFTWTSAQPVDAYTDAACTTSYTSGATITGPIYVKPTLLQLESEVFAFTANANLSNGCTTSGTVTVTNKSKVWTGDLNNDWNVEDNWLPTGTGLPDLTNCVIIPNGRITQITNAPSAFAKSVDLQTGGTLEITSNNNLIIADLIKTNGVMTVRDDANLIQINETDSNSHAGTFNLERTTSLKRYDYVFWSAPIKTSLTNYSTSNISTGSNYRRKWTPTIPTNTFSGINGQWGNWADGNENMAEGKGYLIRVPNSWPTASTDYTSTFSGRPNNGTLTTTVERGTYTGVDYNTGVSSTLATKDDDNWNLVGNPYPSSINAKEFLSANSNLEGFVYIWTHGSVPTSSISPFYSTYTYNYIQTDYITYNATGATVQDGFDGNIASGQGFFVLVKDTAPTSSTITFTNAMRLDGSQNPYDNDSFYKSNNQQNIEEKNRIWIDLIGPNTPPVRMMFGYVTGATNNLDRLYDARTNNSTSTNFYTILDNEIFNIQGRSVPFDSNDSVKIGFKTSTKGNHTIAIANVDGLFNKQHIYIKDNYTGVTHDLSTLPYTFSSESGVFNNRFEIVYNDFKLNNEDVDFSNSIKIIGSEKIIIESLNKSIKKIEIFDILGKSIYTQNNLNETSFIVNDFRKTQTVILVKVTLENGAVVTKKVIY